MKKIILLLAVAVFFSSCGNKMALMKRHYTKGYYVEHASHVAKPAATVNDIARKNTESIGTIRTSSVSQPVVDDEMTASVRASALETKTNARSYQLNLAKHVLIAQSRVHHIKTFALKHNFSALKESQKKGGGDANLILLVILSLFPFICLIAMYLHDGKQVTMNFWVCLLLHLTVVLWFVFALLVDFDVINLA